MLGFSHKFVLSERELAKIGSGRETIVAETTPTEIWKKRNGVKIKDKKESKCFTWREQFGLSKQTCSGKQKKSQK